MSGFFILYLPMNEWIIEDHLFWMDQALREAEKALEAGEVPVGAVVVQRGKLVGRGYNRVEQLQDPTAHAEIIALTAAANTLNSWRLTGCTLYVTLEPCPMCAGALLNSRIDRLVFGAEDNQYGACGGRLQLCTKGFFNHKVTILSGIRETQAQELLDTFFKTIRDRPSQNK